MGGSSGSKENPLKDPKNNPGTQWCDFSKNEILTAEKIIRATYANPERTRFHKTPFKGWEDTPCYYGGDADYFLQKLQTECPETLMAFNNSKIQLHDTSRLNEGVNKEQWLAEIKKSRWYGPFKWAVGEQMGNGEIYYFQSATDSGKFTGVNLAVLYKPKEMAFGYSSSTEKNIGKAHSF